MNNGLYDVNALPFPDAVVAPDGVSDRIIPPDPDELMPKGDDECRAEAIRNYLYALSVSKDPITGELLDDPILKRDDVARALYDAAELIGELTKKEPTTTAVYEKRAFSVEFLDRAAITLTEKPVRIGGFVARINKHITDRGVKNLGAAAVMRWLSDAGYVREDRITVIKSEKAYLPTDMSESVGIVSEDTVDETTGEIRTAVFLTKEAQKFILDNLEKIVDVQK